jgi:hypothetical protein
MARNLKTVASFVEGSAFTEPQVRWWLFNANANGLTEAGAIVRIGRRIYIDVDGFDRWIDAQTAQARAAA